jgi:multisubunit Na+/H+ antiporter MnhC subunit
MGEVFSKLPAFCLHWTLVFMGAFVFLMQVPAKLMLSQCIVMNGVKLYMSIIGCHVKRIWPEEQNEPVF